MNPKIPDDEELKRVCLYYAATAADSSAKLRETPEYANALDRNRKFVKFILSAMESAEEIETLVSLEAMLQEFDLFTAQTDADRNSIRNAQRDYRQLAATIRQMRRNPEEYFEANRSLREVGENIRTIPRSRGIQQINANKIRLQNRATFTLPDQNAVWQARIQLAGKTERMLRALHQKLVDDRP